MTAILPVLNQPGRPREAFEAARELEEKRINKELANIR